MSERCSGLELEVDILMYYDGLGDKDIYKYRYKYIKCKIRSPFVFYLFVDMQKDKLLIVNKKHIQSINQAIFIYIVHFSC